MTPGQNATSAPENQPDGDWRAAFGSLRTEMVGLEGKVDAQGSQLGQALQVLDRISNQVNALGNAQAGMNATTGRISAQMMLAMIAVITPIVVAAAALGHVFVRTGDSHLESRIDITEKAADSLQIQSTKLATDQVDFMRFYAETRWGKTDHEQYHDTVVRPAIEQQQDTRVAIARLEERLEAMAAQFPPRSATTPQPYLIPLTP
jgi:hypothetical protein